jgi:hypothetical protein
VSKDLIFHQVACCLEKVFRELSGVWDGKMAMAGGVLDLEIAQRSSSRRSRLNLCIAIVSTEQVNQRMNSMGAIRHRGSSWLEK